MVAVTSMIYLSTSSTFTTVSTSTMLTTILKIYNLDNFVIYTTWKVSETAYIYIHSLHCISSQLAPS